MATLNVGAGQAYATLSAAVAASRSGDTIAVQAGTYVNDFATISKDISIVGVGGMANFVATQAPPNGKGIFVTQGNVTIENLSFSGAAVPDKNGAGIRYEGGNLVVINSYFHDNQDGILANSAPNGTIRIVGSEFANNGAGDGYSHNLYVNNIASLVIDNSYFHDANLGHEIKSRALSTTITNSRVYDGNSTASYSIDLPNGGVGVIQNNVIQQGPNSDNPAIIHYGGESAAYAGSSLLIEDNVVVNDMSGSSSARLLSNATTVTGTVTGNSVYGLTSGQIASGPATVSGTTFLTTHPTLDTSPGGGSTGGGSTGGGGTGGGGTGGSGPSAVGQVTGLSQDTGTAGDFITNVADQTVKGTYTGTLAAGDVMQVSADGSKWVGATAAAGTWTAAVTLSPGEHTLSVRTVDNAGHIVNGTGHAYDLDLTAPSAVGQVTGLSQDTGTAGDFITSVADQTVKGTYTGTLAAGDVMQVSADGSKWVGATAAAGTWTAAVTLSPGEHTLSVRTVDHAGNIADGTGHAYNLESASGGGQSGSGTISGTAGADTLVGTAGADTMAGLAGNDTYTVNHSGDVVTEASGQGTDTVMSSVSYSLPDNVENLTLTGSGNINGTGNSLANVLTGNSGNNTLDGGAGADHMAGGAGNDTYRVDNARDVVVELNGQGTDTVLSSVSYSLPDNVENLTLSGSGNINGTGNSLANVLTGNSGNNTLNGGAGSDTLAGYGGNDSFVFNTALGPTNVDTITDFNVRDDTIVLDHAIFSAINGTGTLSAAQFTANTSGMAKDGSDHIIYETDTGKLFYDSNSKAPGGMTQFAQLDPGLALTHSDFFVI